MTINEIYKEAQTRDRLESLLKDQNYVRCEESVNQQTALLHLMATDSISILTAIVLHDAVFSDMLKLLAALHFEAGRLFGKQQAESQMLEKMFGPDKGEK
jgi:hypothetical protein